MNSNLAWRDVGVNFNDSNALLNASNNTLSQVGNIFDKMREQALAQQKIEAENQYKELDFALREQALQDARENNLITQLLTAEKYRFEKDKYAEEKEWKEKELTAKLQNNLDVANIKKKENKVDPQIASSIFDSINSGAEQAMANLTIAENAFGEAKANYDSLVANNGSQEDISKAKKAIEDTTINLNRAQEEFANVGSGAGREKLYYEKMLRAGQPIQKGTNPYSSLAQSEIRMNEKEKENQREREKKLLEDRKTAQDARKMLSEIYTGDDNRPWLGKFLGGLTGYRESVTDKDVATTQRLIDAFLEVNQDASKRDVANFLHRIVSKNTDKKTFLNYVKWFGNAPWAGIGQDRVLDYDYKLLKEEHPLVYKKMLDRWY